LYELQVAVVGLLEYAIAAFDKAVSSDESCVDQAVLQKAGSAASFLQEPIPNKDTKIKKQNSRVIVVEFRLKKN
jgi:hypothetical protein